MITLKEVALAAGVCAVGIMGASVASAQTTDGYHAIQVFPVVVDSASFVQRFTFRNPHDSAVSINPRYFPGEGTAQPNVVGCPIFEIPANGVKVFASLRDMCPALVVGTAFGFLYTNETHPQIMHYAAYSRVSNTAGAGFSVEAFPAATFTSANSVVTGLRRLAAAGNAPAYQTNCFIANIAPLGTNTAIVTTIGYQLTSSTGTFLGSGQVNLVPGKLARILDVFAAAGAPAGNHDDARVRFLEVGEGEPGLMTFCTVQDNTSFGADFRIGKQEFGAETEYAGFGSQDQLTTRDSTVSTDVKMPGDVSARSFSIPAGLSRNTHVVYFRHPDWISCEIINPATGVRALVAYGLEMRLAGNDGAVLAGGNEIYGVNAYFTGDKQSYNGGSNGRYTIEVESAGANDGVARPYRLHCESGSGHTLGDMVKSGSPDVF